MKLQLYQNRSIEHIRTMKRICIVMSVTRTVWGLRHTNNLANFNPRCCWGLPGGAKNICSLSKFWTNLEIREREPGADQMITVIIHRDYTEIKSFMWGRNGLFTKRSYAGSDFLHEKVGGMQSWFHFENWPETSHLFQLEQSQWWRAGERNVVSPVQPLPEETSGVRKKRPHYQWMVLFKIIQFCYIFLCSGVFVSLFVF